MKNLLTFTLALGCFTLFSHDAQSKNPKKVRFEDDANLKNIKIISFTKGDRRRLAAQQEEDARRQLTENQINRNAGTTEWISKNPATTVFTVLSAAALADYFARGKKSALAQVYAWAKEKMYPQAATTEAQPATA